MTEKSEAGGPAFPVSTSDSSAGHQDGPNTWQFPGMTLRDYFAAKAMAALLPTIDSEALQRHGLEYLLEKTAFVSYKMADAMLRVRREGK